MPSFLSPVTLFQQCHDMTGKAKAQCPLVMETQWPCPMILFSEYKMLKHSVFSVTGGGRKEEADF